MMAWYSRLISVATTLITPPIPQSLSTPNFYKSTISGIYHSLPIFRSKHVFIRSLQLQPSSSPFLNSSNKSRISNFHSLPMLRSKPVFINNLVQFQLRSSPFLNASGAKRFYNATRNQGSHNFSKRRLKWWIGYTLLYVLLTSYTELFFWSDEYLDTIPFTNRSRFMIFSRDSERRLGVTNVRFLRQKYQGQILPCSHPYHIWVQRVSKDVISGLHVALNTYEANTSHDCLDGLQWEFIVVDDPNIKNAWCCSGGKIVITTTFLETMSSDDELAWVLAHEVAHAVARHPLEIRSKFIWCFFLKNIMGMDLIEEDVSIIRNLLRFPLTVRLEPEADRISLLLTAFAGYDPRVGPKMIKKHVFGIHLCSRIISISRAKFMDEAMEIYRMRSVDKSYPLPATTFVVSKRE